MIKEIIHDPLILARKSAPASAEDVSTADDLLDTLRANRERCVGMAANMIGVCKRIIVFADVSSAGSPLCEMFNPEIIQKSGQYTVSEGCLSLDGERKTVRYSKIKVRYCDRQMRVRMKTFSGFTAQIIQHETDHCDGILI